MINDIDYYDRMNYIEFRRGGKIKSRRKHHEILVWYQKEIKKDKRKSQSDRDKTGIPF